MRILIFGDSTAQGYYDLKMGGWANLLFIDNMKRKARRMDNPVEIFNVSISGDTTQRIVNRLKTEVEARRWETEPIVLVFAVGVNDAMLDNGRPISTPERYRTELEHLYEISRPLARQIVFVGLESVNEAESAPWKFNRGTHELVWHNERLRMFDATLKSFATEKQAYYVPIFDEFIKRQQQGEKLHADGLHPNHTGHELIFQRVKPVIDEIILKNLSA